MPTLLEPSPAVETLVRSSSRTGAATDKTQLEADRHEGEVRNSRPKIAMKLREIFEGHEEFLGWTPD